MGFGTNEAAGVATASATANVVKMAAAKVAASSLRVGEVVMVRMIDEFEPARITEEGEGLVQWVRVRLTGGGPAVKVCRDQCRPATRAEQAIIASEYPDLQRKSA